MSKLICDIVTPAKKLYSEDVYMVTVPGVEGEMGFLESHEPLVSVLADGIARVQPEKESEMFRYVLQGGYVQVTGEKVIVLADRACGVEDIDTAEVRERLTTLEAESNSLEEGELRRTTLSDDIAWCNMLLQAVEK